MNTAAHKKKQQKASSKYPAKTPSRPQPKMKPYNAHSFARRQQSLVKDAMAGDKSAYDILENDQRMRDRALSFNFFAEDWLKRIKRKTYSKSRNKRR